MSGQGLSETGTAKRETIIIIIIVVVVIVHGILCRLPSGVIKVIHNVHISYICAHYWSA